MFSLCLLALRQAGSLQVDLIFELQSLLLVEHPDRTAGCDKRRETCRDKFANILNFQGFPFMPGSDFAYGYADGETVHDGRPLIP